MSAVYIAGHSIYSPLGLGSGLNYDLVANGTSALAMHSLPYADRPLPLALFAGSVPVEENGVTRFEKLCIDCVLDALLQSPDFPVSSEHTLLLLSTTKGNIELIEELPLNAPVPSAVSLIYSARVIAAALGITTTPYVVSNACTSGVLAISVATRLLEGGQYKNAIIIGADVLSRFVVSGFLSLTAIGTGYCKPYDATRDGISLGECAAAMLLTTDEAYVPSAIKARVLGSASGNDANHISGPSKTGKELGDTVTKAMQYSGVGSEELAFISSHGTATIYNDEMESKAFESAGLSNVPLFSLKPVFGHTLGASGLVESIISIQALARQTVLPNYNFDTKGVSGNIHVNKSITQTTKNHALKTASGFGGCNAAIVFSVK